MIRGSRAELRTGANGCIVRMIRRLENAVLPVNDDLADLHFGAFVDVESKLHRVCAGDSFIGGLDGGELAAMLGKQLLQDDFGFLDPCGIELAFDRQADFAVLEPVQDVGFGDGLVALDTRCAG